MTLSGDARLINEEKVMHNSVLGKRNVHLNEEENGEDPERRLIDDCSNCFGKTVVAMLFTKLLLIKRPFLLKHFK